MTIFFLSDNLSLRVGRDGVWIWAPSVASTPIHLDRRRLAEMGLRLDLPATQAGATARARLSLSCPDPPGRSVPASIPPPKTGC